MESSHECAVSAERARAVAESEATQQAAEVRRLEKILEEEAVREGLVEELRGQLENMEEQLGKLQAEVSENMDLSTTTFDPPSFPSPSLPQLEISQDDVLSLHTEARTAREKEHQWSSELARTSSQLQVGSSEGSDYLCTHIFSYSLPTHSCTRSVSDVWSTRLERRRRKWKSLRLSFMQLRECTTLLKRR